MKTLSDFYKMMAAADYVQEGDTFGSDSCDLYVFGLVAVSVVEKENGIRVTITTPWVSSAYKLSKNSDYTKLIDTIDYMQVETF